MNMVRKLNSDEIEIKPCQVAKDKSWVQVLLYKTSRVDMQILTEMYGNKWKSSYQMVGDSLFCTISVFDDELNEWVSRQDCGEKDASDGISEEKAYATSAFKRAATQFGIGAELYATPRIKIPTQESWFYNGKMNMTFNVKSIKWDDNNLVDLVITDKFGNVVWNLNKPNTQKINTPQPTNKIDDLVEFCKQAKADGADQEQLAKFYNFYKEKIDVWDGNFNPQALWTNWMNRAKKAA